MSLPPENGTGSAPPPAGTLAPEMGLQGTPAPQRSPSWLGGPSPSPALGAPWGPGRVFAGVGLLLAVITITAAIIIGIEGDEDSLAGRLVLQASLALGMIIAAFAVVTPPPLPARERITRSALLGLGRSLRAPWGSAALAYGAYLGCAFLLALLISPEQEDVTRELGWGESTLGDISSFVLIVLAAPIAEEIFFRGFMFAGIRSRTGFLAAALISGCIWGLVHFTGSDSWPVVAQLSIFGVILAWLYERTGSIRPAIAVHMINNALAFIVLTSS